MLNKKTIKLSCFLPKYKGSFSPVDYEVELSFPLAWDSADIDRHIKRLQKISSKLKLKKIDDVRLVIHECNFNYGSIIVANKLLNIK